MKGAVDDRAQTIRINFMRIFEWGERDRREIERLPLRCMAAHGKRLAGPTHQETGKRDLRAGRTDINAHTDERHAFQRTRTFAKHRRAAVMIMVMIGIFVMHMIGIRAKQMVANGMLKRGA
jgi:hypothetical protein